MSAYIPLTYREIEHKHDHTISNLTAKYAGMYYLVDDAKFGNAMYDMFVAGYQQAEQDMQAELTPTGSGSTVQFEQSDGN